MTVTQTVDDAPAAEGRIDKNLYTTSDLVIQTQLSLTTIKRMIAARKVPGAIRFGRSLRFRKAVIDKWLAGR